MSTRSCDFTLCCNINCNKRGYSYMWSSIRELFLFRKFLKLQNLKKVHTHRNDQFNVFEGNWKNKNWAMYAHSKKSSFFSSHVPTLFHMSKNAFSRIIKFNLSVGRLNTRAKTRAKICKYRHRDFLSIFRFWLDISLSKNIDKLSKSLITAITWTDLVFYKFFVLLMWHSRKFFKCGNFYY